MMYVPLNLELNAQRKNYEEYFYHMLFIFNNFIYE